MVPKLHKKGTSFKGAAAYLLHDKGRRETNERVEWTATRNLATDNPQAAWRVMAATALDGGRRKAEAGIKATGRKSKDSVLHLTLSWHPDETEKVTREEMLRASDGALKALGAQDRQVLIVSHNDEPQPHVHLLINRVSSHDGRMLSSSKEKLALSKWAEAWEKDHGKVVCPQRVKNNERRSRGEYVRGEADEARHIFEAKGKAAKAVKRSPQGNDKARFREVVAQERKKDAQLAERERAMKSRHITEWLAINERHLKAKTTLKQKAKNLLPLYTLRIEKKFLSARDSFEEKQRKIYMLFAKKEKTVLGRMSNRLASIDFPALLQNKNKERQTLRDAFKCFTSSKERMERFKKQQRAEQKTFDEKLKKSLVAGKVRIFAGWRVRRVRVFKSLGQQRFDLFNQQEQERLVIGALWANRGREREASLKSVSCVRPRQERTSIKKVRDDIDTVAPSARAVGEKIPVRSVEDAREKERKTSGSIQDIDLQKPVNEPSLAREETAAKDAGAKEPTLRPEANRARFRGDDDDYGRERRRR